MVPRGPQVATEGKESLNTIGHRLVSGLSMEHTVLQLMKSLPFQGGMPRMKMPPGGVVERRFPRRGLFVLSAMIGAVGAMNILLGLVDLANILTSLNRCEG